MFLHSLGQQQTSAAALAMFALRGNLAFHS